MWNYAELTQAAKAAGGPELFVEMVKVSARASGRLQGAAVVALPCVFLGGLAVLGYQKYQKVRLRGRESEDALVEFLHVEDESVSAKGLDCDGPDMVGDD